MCCYNDTNPYPNACRQDIPYPSISAESVPSLINNLTTALYGAINKSVVSGRVVWDIPCDPSQSAQINGIPRSSGEGLLCYILRVLALNAPAYPNALVYTDGSQTLTNKTLTSPIISTPAVSGGTFSTPTITTPVINGAITGTGTLPATQVSAGALPTSVTIVPSQIQSGTLPSGVAVTSSNIASGTITSDDLVASLDLSSKTLVNLPTATTINSTSTPGGLVYSGSGTLGYTAAGTSGQILVSQGSSTPIWSYDRKGNPSNSAAADNTYVGAVVDTATTQNQSWSTTSSATTVTATSWTNIPIGDWEINGSVLITFSSATVTAATVMGACLTTNGSWVAHPIQAGVIGNSSLLITPVAVTTTTSSITSFTNVYSFNIPSFQVLSAGSTTVTLLVRLPTFSLGNVLVNGVIHARRSR
jgi:hypothetical protein